MTEAAPSITRRGFLGHAAGAYTAVTLVAGAGIVPTMAALIRRHRVIAAELDVATQALDENPSEMNRLIEENLSLVEQDALDQLARYRPATVEEAGERLSYLFLPGGPWYMVPPNEEMWMEIIATMMPETV